MPVSTVNELMSHRHDKLDISPSGVDKSCVLQCRTHGFEVLLEFHDTPQGLALGPSEESEFPPETPRILRVPAVEEMAEAKKPSKIVDPATGSRRTRLELPCNSTAEVLDAYAEGKGGIFYYGSGQMTGREWAKAMTAACPKGYNSFTPAVARRVAETFSPEEYSFVPAREYSVCVYISSLTGSIPVVEQDDKTSAKLRKMFRADEVSTTEERGFRELRIWWD